MGKWDTGRLGHWDTGTQGHRDNDTPGHCDNVLAFRSSLSLFVHFIRPSPLFVRFFCPRQA